MPDQQADPETCGHNDEELTDQSLVRCLDCGAVFQPDGA